MATICLHKSKQRLQLSSIEGRKQKDLKFYARMYLLGKLVLSLLLLSGRLETLRFLSVKTSSFMFALLCVSCFDLWRGVGSMYLDGELSLTIDWANFFFVPWLCSHLFRKKGNPPVWFASLMTWLAKGRLWFWIQSSQQLCIRWFCSNKSGGSSKLTWLCFPM